MLAYIAMMGPRLKELHRVLKPTGSIYLHCDSTASHYLKILMDAIFEPQNFRNEIIWKRTSSHSNATRRFGEQNDVLLYFSKTDAAVFNRSYVPHSEKYLKSHYSMVDESGRRFTTRDMRNPSVRPNLMYEYKGYKPHRNGWTCSKERMEQLDSEGRLYFPNSKDGRIRLKIYLDESQGTPVGNVWDDIPPINSQAQERIGWPTQKPQALLERIISVSSQPGALVLDPFCGCGTAIEAAQKLNRAWIGIDITPIAIGVVKDRLRKAFGAKIGHEYRTTYEPRTVEAARALAAEDPFEFQCWIVEKLGGSAANEKRGADRGIDGRIYFRDDPSAPTKHIVVSVKSGKHLTPSFVRDLRGTMERAKAVLGVLVCLEQPTKAMVKEALGSGHYKSLAGIFPRVQVVTVQDILSGRGLMSPPIERPDPSKKRPPGSSGRGEGQLGLPGIR